MTAKKPVKMYEIRSGVYAFGVPGQRATAVVERFKGTGPFRGVRGIKPLITETAREAQPVQEAVDALTRLSGKVK